MDNYERKILMDKFEVEFIKYRELIAELQILIATNQIDDPEVIMDLYELAARAQKCIHYILIENPKEGIKEK